LGYTLIRSFAFCFLFLFIKKTLAVEYSLKEKGGPMNALSNFRKRSRLALVAITALMIAVLACDLSQFSAQDTSQQATVAALALQATLAAGGQADPLQAT
jgi:hypothetical protein